jgi:chorismate-pyruvate lyase
VEHRLETREEILRMWRAPVGELSGYFGVPPERELLARSYRVFSGQRPIMLIAEHFLIDLAEPA